MRVECEACHQLVDARMALDGDTLRVTCAACDHVMRPALAAAPAAIEPAAVPPPLNVNPRDADVDDADPIEPAVRDAWRRVRDGWAEPARHDELLRAVAAHSAYAWAARRYRARGADAIATRQLERLSRAAAATLLVGATARTATPTPYRTTWAVLAALIGLIVVGLAYAALREPAVASHAAPAGPRAPGAGPRTLGGGRAPPPSTEPTAR